MEFKNLRIEELKPAGYNPRKELTPDDAEYQKIKRSIDEFGYVDPVIVNADMTVIGGHQRLKVLKDLGYDEIECVMIDIDKDHEKALNLALNKITGEWDDAKLKDLLQELDTGAIDMDITGFDFDEIEQLLGQEHQEEASEDDFDTDEALVAIVEPKAKHGDVYRLGKHRLMCGDSTKAEDVEKLMDGQMARMMLTDPPYNVNYEGTAGKIENDNMSDDNFYEFLCAAFTQMYENAEQGCPIYVFHSDSEGLNFRKAYKEAGFKLAECLVWVKNALVMGRQDYQWRHEPILYGWKEGAGHHWYGARNKTTVFDDTADIDKMKKEDMSTLLHEIMDAPSTILYENKPTINDLHPTMKPLKLCGKIISNSSEAGDIILDSFAGSGSTMMAAEQLGRSCYTMEFDPKYVDVIIKRWETFTGKAAEKV